MAAVFKSRFCLEGARVFILDLIKQTLSLVLVIPLITFVGLYFSHKLKWLQLTQFSKAISFISPKHAAGALSSLGAVSAVLGGNLGTGNIAGIAVALSTGGPGALFWMWIMALVGSILKYAGCYLGIQYRHTNADGTHVGGPMYYLSKGLKKPYLAMLFCVLTICGALTTGNLVQINSLALPLKSAGFDPLPFGVVIAALIGFTILGGMKRFCTVVSSVVPAMAVAYLGACLYILCLHYERIIPAFETIVLAAFGLKPLVGGAVGYGLFAAIRTGFDRGLFATDIGLGLAPMLHAPVTSNIPGVPNTIAQGIMSVLSPVIVMIMCMLTGLVLMVTNVWQQADLESTNQCMEAFCVGLGFSQAGMIVLITLFFFAFTTVLTWSFCADRAVEYLFGKKAVKIFQLLFVAVIPLGTVVSVKMAWQMADVFLNLMLFINMIGIWGLRKPLIETTQKFLRKANKATTN